MLSKFWARNPISVISSPFQSPRREAQQGDDPAADDGAQRAADVVRRAGPGGGPRRLHRAGRRRRVSGAELQAGKGPRGDHDKGSGEFRTQALLFIVV